MEPIMFHYFHDHGGKYKKVDGALSAEQLELIITNDKFKVLSADIWINKFFTNTLADNETCLTFDDGIQEQFDIAVPILNKYGLKGLFSFCSLYFTNDKDNFEIYRYFRNQCFKSVNDYYQCYFDYLSSSDSPYRSEYFKIVNEINFSDYLAHASFYTTNDRKFRYFRDIVLKEHHIKIMDELIKRAGLNVEDISRTLWINSEDIKLISKKHLIAMHSHEHPTVIDTWSYKQQEASYSLNQKILEGFIECPIDIAVYPCGKFNEYTTRVLTSLNIKCGFVASQTQVIDNQAPFLIPRIDSTDFCKLIGII